MPVKTEIKPAKTKSEKLQYPVIMQSTDSELIVLFINDFAGTVLHKEEQDGSKLGDHWEQFISPTNEETWKKFTGELILKNT